MNQKMTTGKLKNILTDDNENIIHQDLWDKANETVKRKFSALNVYIKK